jgi:hypothetical protein
MLGDPLVLDPEKNKFLVTEADGLTATKEMPAGGFKPNWWSPALKGRMMASEFARIANWQAELLPNETQPSEPEPGGERPSLFKDGPTKEKAPNDDIAKAVVTLIKKMDQRPGRMGEIVAQSSDFAGAFLDLLDAGGGRKPATAALVHAGIEIGSILALHWKWKFNALRPVHVYPGLTPVLPTPPHPSYPSGHATQAQLTALIVSAALPAAVRLSLGDALESLANRIAENREVAGLHFSFDTEAGKTIANAWGPYIIANADKLPLIKETLAAASAEWEGLKPGNLIGKVDPPPSFVTVLVDALTKKLNDKKSEEQSEPAPGAQAQEQK